MSRDVVRHRHDEGLRHMLDKCAEGHQFKRWGDHYYIVIYRDREFPQFPTGEKGKFNPEIKRGLVKKMAHHLGIYDCAKQELGLS